MSKDRPSSDRSRFAAAVLTLLVAQVAWTNPLGEIHPGESTAADIVTALGPPVERSDNASVPVERFEAPDSGVKSLTAWYDGTGKLHFAKAELVRQLPPVAAAVLFPLQTAVRISEGDAFGDGQMQGRTEHYDSEGVHFVISSSVVSAIWLIAPGDSIENVKRTLDSQEGKYALIAATADVIDAGGQIDDSQEPGEDDSGAEDDTAVSDTDSVDVTGEHDPADFEEAPDAVGWLGVAIRALTENEREQYPAAANGVIVESVYPASPGDKAGLRKLDIITSFDGSSITDANQLALLTASKRPGSYAKVDFVRGSTFRSAIAKLGRRPEAAGPVGEVRPGGVMGDLGFLLRPVTERAAKAAALPDTEGAYISGVIKGGAADAAGLRSGDIVVSFEGIKIKRIEHLREVLSATAPGTKVKVEVARAGDRLLVDAVVDRLR